MAISSSRFIAKPFSPTDYNTSLARPFKQTTGDFYLYRLRSHSFNRCRFSWQQRMLEYCVTRDRSSELEQSSKNSLLCDKSYREGKAKSVRLRLMFILQPKYRKFLVITLVMLLAIPCSVKKEAKQWLQIVESGQQSNTAQSKIACTNYYNLKQASKKKQAQKHIHPFVAPSEQARTPLIANKISIPGFFSAQKEKIPSHILLEQFLI